MPHFRLASGFSDLAFSNRFSIVLVSALLLISSLRTRLSEIDLAMYAVWREVRFWPRVSFQARTAFGRLTSQKRSTSNRRTDHSAMVVS